MRILNTTLSFAAFVWASGSAYSGEVARPLLLIIGGAIGLAIGIIAAVASGPRHH